MGVIFAVVVMVVPRLGVAVIVVVAVIMAVIMAVSLNRLVRQHRNTLARVKNH